MDNDVAIKVTNVSKSFKLPHDKQNSIKGGLISLVKGGKRTYEKQEVLKDVSFEIKKGDFFGIVGRNGSGKSTLLKMLAGIYQPSEGSIRISGKLTPFIELGVGFNPELTGRENVYLNGALLGFNRRQMEEMYDDIVAFAEIERFMDQKLKNYSSGMQVRLAFSIAIRANTDILVLDEVLAVGDYNFQQKCFEYFRTLKKQKKTVILVSHDSNAIQMFCNRAILIERGEIIDTGAPIKVLKTYAEQNQSDQEKALVENAKNQSIDRATGSIELIDAYLLRGQKRSSVFGPKDKISVCFELQFKHEINNPVFGIVVQSTEGGQPVFATNTLDSKKITRHFVENDRYTVVFSFDNIFNDGKYIISGAVASSDRSVLFVRYMNVMEFSSVGWEVTAKGRVYLDYDFELSELTKGSESD